MLSNARIPPAGNVRLPSGLVLSARMIHFVFNMLEYTSCNADCMACHFDEFWAVELGREDILDIIAGRYHGSSAMVHWGELDLHNELGDVIPMGVYHDIVRLGLTESNVFIQRYIEHRWYGSLVSIGLIESVLLDHDARSLQRHYQGYRYRDPSVRPRHTGHRQHSLPTEAVTPREGRTRTSFSQTPPPLWSPTRPGGHPGQVAGMIPPLGPREIGVPQYSPPPAYGSNGRAGEPQPAENMSSLSIRHPPPTPARSIHRPTVGAFHLSSPPPPRGGGAGRGRQTGSGSPTGRPFLPQAEQEPFWPDLPEQFDDMHRSGESGVASGRANVRSPRGTVPQERHPDTPYPFSPIHSTAPVRPTDLREATTASRSSSPVPAPSQDTTLSTPQAPNHNNPRSNPDFHPFRSHSLVGSRPRVDDSEDEPLLPFRNVDRTFNRRSDGYRYMRLHSLVREVASPPLSAPLANRGRPRVRFDSTVASPTRRQQPLATPTRIISPRPSFNSEGSSLIDTARPYTPQRRRPDDRPALSLGSPHSSSSRRTPRSGDSDVRPLTLRSPESPVRENSSSQRYGHERADFEPFPEVWGRTQAGEIPYPPSSQNHSHYRSPDADLISNLDSLFQSTMRQMYPHFSLPESRGTSSQELEQPSPQTPTRSPPRTAVQIPHRVNSGDPENPMAEQPPDNQLFSTQTHQPTRRQRNYRRNNIPNLTSFYNSITLDATERDLQSPDNPTTPVANRRERRHEAPPGPTAGRMQTGQAGPTHPEVMDAAPSPWSSTSDLLTPHRNGDAGIGMEPTGSPVPAPPPRRDRTSPGRYDYSQQSERIALPGHPDRPRPIEVPRQPEPRNRRMISSSHDTRLPFETTEQGSTRTELVHNTEGLRRVHREVRGAEVSEDLQQYVRQGRMETLRDMQLLLDTNLARTLAEVVARTAMEEQRQAQRRAQGQDEETENAQPSEEIDRMIEGEDDEWRRRESVWRDIYDVPRGENPEWWAQTWENLQEYGMTEPRWPAVRNVVENSPESPEVQEVPITPDHQRVWTLSNSPHLTSQTRGWPGQQHLPFLERQGPAYPPGYEDQDSPTLEEYVIDRLVDEINLSDDFRLQREIERVIERVRGHRTQPGEELSPSIRQLVEEAGRIEDPSLRFDVEQAIADEIACHRRELERSDRH